MIAWSDPGKQVRDIKSARTMMANDMDWAFAMAYNAILQATRALMFSKGFRPSTGEGRHKLAVRFAEITLGEKFHKEIYIFDKMRNKRHHFTERSSWGIWVCREVR
jgi:uncharacterized protein (UPF0332 family)